MQAAPGPRRGGLGQGRRGFRGPAWVPELGEPTGAPARSHCSSRVTRRKHLPGWQITPRTSPTSRATGDGAGTGARRVACSHAAGLSPVSHTRWAGTGCWRPPCSVPPAGGVNQAAMRPSLKSPQSKKCSHGEWAPAWPGGQRELPERRLQPVRVPRASAAGTSCRVGRRPGPAPPAGCRPCCGAGPPAPDAP